MKNFKKIVYVAGEYGGKEKNKKLMEDSCKLLSLNYPNYLFINGISQFCYFNEDDYHTGLSKCLTLMLKSADEVWMLPNYTNSKGSMVELFMAESKSIPVRFLSVRIEEDILVSVDLLENAKSPLL